MELFLVRASSSWCAFTGIDAPPIPGPQRSTVAVYPMVITAAAASSNTPALCAAWPWDDSGQTADTWDGGPFVGSRHSGSVAEASMSFLGSPVQIEAYSRKEQRLPYASQLTPTLLDRHVSRYAPKRQWAAVTKRALRRGRLHVTVIGVSTAAGGGADEAWDLNALPTGGASPSGRDRSDRSWPRRLADDLVSGLSVPVHINVFAKHAVGAGFFAHCTSSFLPSNGADIVLLELATNIWGGDVSNTVRAVQRAADGAAIVFVVWPSQQQILAADHHADLRMVNASAHALGIDVIHLPQLLTTVAAGEPEKIHSVRKSLWARHGRDAVHPNPHGHALIAGVTARHIVRRLCELTTRGDHGKLLHTHEVDPPEKSEAAAEAVMEECHPNAGQLPLAAPLSGSWAIVDEGGSHGVPKLGLLSRSPGDSVLLRPWGVTGCHWLKVSIGYLVSAYRSSLAGFSIECTGCKCGRLRSPVPKMFPWPTVQTYAPYNDDEIYWQKNVSVTAETSFYILTQRQRDCVLKLRHIPSDGGRRVRSLFPDRNLTGVVPPPPNRSEVRIDSITAVKYCPQGELPVLTARGKSSPSTHQLAFEWNRTCGPFCSR